MQKLVDKIYAARPKSGSRFEYSLSLTEDLKALGKSITNVPLKFASLLFAVPGQNSQNFHFDSKTGERAIVYLDDVLGEEKGPIEFLSHGKVFGKAGTFAHYQASEIHRGFRASTQRYALALAFSNETEPIETVGMANACDYKCPFGFLNKDCVSPCTRDNCCKFNQWPLVLAFLVLVGLFFLKKYAVL
jgi:hypothetical protein